VLPSASKDTGYQMPNLNRQVILSSRPDGIPESDHFQIIESPIP